MNPVQCSITRNSDFEKTTRNRHADPVIDAVKAGCYRYSMAISGLSIFIFSAVLKGSVEETASDVILVVNSWYN
jgi:hypothetical protein